MKPGMGSRAARALPTRFDMARTCRAPHLHRRARPSEVLLTTRPGYALRVEPGLYDVALFEQLARAGREALSAGDAASAAEHLRNALAMWRGPALAEFVYEPFATQEAARLEEGRLAAFEDKVEADLTLGRHGEVVAELEPLVAEHPLRERPSAQLMRALYRAGRQAA